MNPVEAATFAKIAHDSIRQSHLDGSRLIAAALVDLAADPVLGVPFDSEHDTAIVAAWIEETAADLIAESARRLKEQT